MPGPRKERQALVDRFVASFERLTDLSASEILDPIAWQLAAGNHAQFGRKRWRPLRVITEASALEQLHSRLPARLPPLFELLLTEYRWAEVDLQFCRLIANPPGPGLCGFLSAISKDPAIWKCLSRTGFIQFGRGPESDYDPVCFDTASRTRSGDCRIVKIDHEQILCNDRVQITEELASSFEQLMLRTIERANSSARR